MHGAAHPDGHGQADDDDQDDAQDHRRPAEYQARERRPVPSSPVRLISCQAEVPLEPGTEDVAGPGVSRVQAHLPDHQWPVPRTQHLGGQRSRSSRTARARLPG